VDRAAELLARWHYAGLFAVILVEEAGVPLPLPGDLFILAMGVLAWQGGASFVPTAAVVTLATVLGASLLYLVSRHAGRPLLVRIARRFGYTEAREARLEAWLARRGAVAVGVGRLVPGLRIVMTVVAGALRLSPPAFLAGTLVAGLVWATLYFWLGWALAAGLGSLEPGTWRAGAWPIAAGVVLAAAALHLAWRRRDRARAARDVELTR
jgi:membrane protein DedA with SNARE-associated domain